MSPLDFAAKAKIQNNIKTIDLVIETRIVKPPNDLNIITDSFSKHGSEKRLMLKRLLLLGKKMTSPSILDLTPTAIEYQLILF
jgi:hypothetical protein